MNAINIIPYIEAIIAILSLINSKTTAKKKPEIHWKNQR